MLTELHIENLGVIERVTLVLGPGLTAVTGETGAGKTMLVEAVELLVGGRADPVMVRSGAAEARVEGRVVDRDEELVLGRVVPVDGRSRAYVNGRLATAASLAELATGLIDLHGQHAHQRLLSATTQRDALDRFGGIDLEPLRAARARITELDAELAALGGDERARAREIDLLRFQVAELDAAGLDDPAEESALERVEDTLADAAAHRAAGDGARSALGDDGGARDALSAAAGLLGGRAPYGESAARLASILAELDDVADDVRRVAEEIEEDPIRLDAVRQRRQLLRDLCRKYGDDLTAVVGYRDQARERLAALEGFDRRAATLDDERQVALSAERDAARAVGEARRRAAPSLAAAVVGRLRRLALPHAELAIEVGEHVEDHPGDRVQLLLSANPGSPLLPLTKVASGGELARTMLALHLALSDVERPATTHVFDEVDAGIGGAAADAVGRALADLGDHQQVLVVTHLAQVAALATTQVAIDKHVRAGVTVADVGIVEGPDRVDEIARMMSGTASRETARRHAHELLASARSR